MARIRSVKPEFWDSEDTAVLSPLVALTYVGLWNLADDEGRGRYAPLTLHSRLHGARNGVSLKLTRGALDELRDSKLIHIYTDQGGAEFFYIPSFRRHQKPNRPQPSKLPPPPPEFTEYSVNPEGMLPVGSVVGGGGGEGEEKERRGEGSSESPPAAAAPGDVERLAAAAHEVDKTIPEHKAADHIRRALARGVHPEGAFLAIKARGGAEKLWTILDSLPPLPERRAAPRTPYRGPTVDPRPAGDLKATRDAARAAVDAKLVEMDPAARLVWREEAKAAATAAGLPADKHEAFILSQMRVRAAKEFGIEGL